MADVRAKESNRHVKEAEVPPHQSRAAQRVQLNPMWPTARQAQQAIMHGDVIRVARDAGCVEGEYAPNNCPVPSKPSQLGLHQIGNYICRPMRIRAIAQPGIVENSHTRRIDTEAFARARKLPFAHFAEAIVIAVREAEYEYRVL